MFWWTEVLNIVQLKFIIYDYQFCDLLRKVLPTSRSWLLFFFLSYLYLWSVCNWFFCVWCDIRIRAHFPPYKNPVEPISVACWLSFLLSGADLSVLFTYLYSKQGKNLSSLSVWWDLLAFPRHKLISSLLPSLLLTLISTW